MTPLAMIVTGCTAAGFGLGYLTAYTIDLLDNGPRRRRSRLRELTQGGEGS